MSGPTVADDPVVSAALRLLPVPEHRDGFWDDLDLALQVDAALDRPPVLVAPAAPHASAAAPAQPQPQPLVPDALRRRSNAALLAVAVAAVVVVAVAGQSLLANRTGTARRPAASPDLEALVERSRPADTAPEPLSSADELAATEAVLTWVAAVAGGSASEAWTALGPQARDRFGSQEAFEAEMGSMADVYAPWAGESGAEVIVTPVAVDDDVTLAVVTLSTQAAVEAVPVRLTDDGVVVEPLASAAADLELVVPEASPDDDVADAVDVGDELLVVVPAGVAAPLLRVDDGTLVVCGEAEGSRLTTLDDGSAQRCAFLPPGGVTAGRHTLTVAFRAADGSSLSARSVLFDAA